MGLAGPSLPALDRSGPRQTSTGEIRSAVGLNRRDSARRGTSTGPQRPETISYRLPKKMPDRMPDKMPEDMPDRVSKDMPEKMPDRMSEDMPEDMPDRMSEDMPDGMPDRYAR